MDLRTDTMKTLHNQNMLTILGLIVNMIGGGVMNSASCEANGHGHGLDLLII